MYYLTFLQFTRTPIYRLKGTVVRGFGRGSKLLGFPTANLDPKAFKDILKDVPRGVYFGWASIRCPKDDGSTSKVCDKVYKTMLSLGTNPHFQGVEDTVEAYICNDFEDDFYGCEMRLLICAYIRPMTAFDSLDSLIKAINNDVEIGQEALLMDDLLALKDDSLFTQK